MEEKKLGSLIEMGTDEKLGKKDSGVNGEIGGVMRSRADLPKVALGLIRRRLLVNNSQVIALSLDLLSDLSHKGDLPFFTQICSKEFLQQIQSLLLFKKNDSLVHPRLLSLIQLWHSHLQDKQDILPSFFHFYNALLKKGIVFPSPPPSSSSNNNNLPKRQGKYAKLEDDLEAVQSNICLTNDLLNNIQPQESLTNNETVKDTIKRILEAQKKLQELITNNDIQDEKVMQNCLDLNDDCMNVLRKYKDIKSGKKYYYKPPVVTTPIPSKVQSNHQDDLLDMGYQEDQPPKQDNNNFNDIFDTQHNNYPQQTNNPTQSQSQMPSNTLTQLYNIQSQVQTNNNDNSKYDVFSQNNDQKQQQQMLMKQQQNQQQQQMNQFNQMNNQMNFNNNMPNNQPVNQSMFNMNSQNQFNNFSMNNNMMKSNIQNQAQSQINDPFEKIDQNQVFNNKTSFNQNVQQQQFGNDDDLI